jgi:BNR repeat protein
MPADVIDCQTFMASPRQGVAVHAATYYTTLEGGNVISIHGYESRSDTCDVAYVRHSEDGGRTWTQPVEWATEFPDPKGTRRRHARGGYVDTNTGRYLTVSTEGVLPTDDPIEGMRQWTVHYSVSEDGGQTDLMSDQIIHDGPGYDAVHHLPGVTVGTNCVMMGDLGQRPLTRADGVILVPVQSTPVGPDGQYWNPTGGMTYTDCIVLMGRWRPDGRLAWTASERICGDPARSTRGMVEPTIAELADGSILMVMRGSNDANPALPGHKWFCSSRDRGQTWSQPEPWAYTDGRAFHSPSSCSQLIPHSDGRLFWMGNLCTENPRGNSPRYPIVLAEVDRDSGLVVRDTVTAIDDRQPGESPHLTLSNFYVREDRPTGHLLLHLTRLFAHDFREADTIDWTADAMQYRIAVQG